MDKQKVLARLVSDLQTFLLVLDSENLSYIAQAQKKSISELLSKLQDQKETPVEDAEYMIMNCPSGGPGADLRETSLSETLDSAVTSTTSTEWLQRGSLGPVAPPVPPEGLDDDDDCYEEAEPFIPASQSTVDFKSVETQSHPECTFKATLEKLDSESSHYESYGEDEDEDFVKDRAHYIQWSASQPCLRPVPESRICGYLWRKKWLGQWTRQLFIIKHTSLLCFKCAKDLHPLLEINLRGCQVVYKSKHSKKMQHELKVVSDSDTIIMGFQSCSQAEEWRKIIEELSGSSYYEAESHSSLSALKTEGADSCRSSTVLHTDSDEETLCGLPSGVSSLEINKEKDRAGYLNVLMNCQWQSLWCKVEDGVLKMFCDEVCEDTPQYSVHLRGSEVRPGPDTAHAYRITILQHGDQAAVLEASCSDDKERWVQLLQDGSSTAVGSQYQHTSHESLSGLKIRRFPTSNTYMDDPFQQLSVQSQPIYSNTSILEHMFQKSHAAGNGGSGSSSDSANYSNNEIFSHSGKKGSEVERSVQKLELAGKRRVQLRAGSEMNLVNVGSKPQKRSSFRQSLLPFCSERTQGGFLTPLLRRTASVKNSLKRAPSALFIEHGKVFQRRKEWETKTSP